MATTWYINEDKNILQVNHFMLKQLKHEMRSYSNAHDAAQALLAGEKPDIIILEVNMPEVSGVDLLEFIRGRQIWDQLPVILLASEHDQDKIIPSWLGILRQILPYFQLLFGGQGRKHAEYQT